MKSFHIVTLKIFTNSDFGAFLNLKKITKYIPCIESEQKFGMKESKGVAKLYRVEEYKEPDSY